MIIHFFRERVKPRIDYFQLIDNYFDSLPNSSISSNDDEVKITISYPNFDFEYAFFITKRSRVSSLYKLNIEYTSTNLLCEVPFFIPQYISRLIFKQISDLCEKFELAIYYEKYEDITKFDMFQLIDFLGKERIKYLDEHLEVSNYRIPNNILNDMCRYQSLVDVLPKQIKELTTAPKYTILCDNRTGEVRNSVIWKAGSPMIFPPHLNYIQVVEDDNLVALVPAEMFFHHAGRMMYELKDKNIDLKILYLNEKSALRVKKLIKKMRKAVLSLTDFTEIKITDLIEY